MTLGFVFCYADCCNYSNIMLGVLMPIVMLNVVMLSALYFIVSNAYLIHF